MKHSKYIVSPLHFFLLLAVPFLFSVSVLAVDPSVTLTTYYAKIDGKATDSNDNLRQALCTIISNGYTTIGYSSLPNSVYAASSDPSDFYHGSGSIKTMEDIYSSYPYNSSQDGSSATTCGTGWNKEHTVPQSWFGKESPMVSDAHHVFPTDIRMNSCRSNYPYGENNASKYCSSYGYGHLGTSTFSGYTGQVFDPGSKEDCGGKCYRGDLARVYFYMATRYRTTNFTSGTGGTSFTYTNGVADLTDYMKNLMLKWHREDPVSEKELIRNNAIYAHQKNRNPFVDYPCLAEYIWGDKKGEAVSLSSLISGYVGVGTDCCSSEPTLTVSSSSITIGPIATSSSTTQTFTVTGANLTGSISITKNSGSSSYITVSPTSITSGYNGTNPITITYNAPASAGTHTATLTISSTGATPVTVNITASCAASCTATWMADGSTFGTSTAASGASPELPAPNPSNCTSSRVFVGWTATSGYTGNSAPADLFTTTAPTITTDKTFYAVYADATTTGSGSVNTTVSMSTFTTVSGDVDGDSNVSYAATQGAAANAPAINSNVIRIYQNGGLLTITANNGKKLTSITIGSSMATKVTYAIDGGSASSNQSITAGKTFTLNSINATSVVFTCTGTDKNSRLYLNNLSVTYSGSGTTTTYNNYSTMCSACTPVAATASFASSTKATTVGGTVTNTFTTNSNATVSYASSNTSVATVASDGTVTPLSVGTTTITATVPANTCFTGGASASYTLTVYNFNATAATDVTCSSFTANWTSAGAASYSLDVFQETTTSTTTTEAATFYSKNFTSDISNWTVHNVSGYTNVWNYNSSYSCAYATSYVSGTRYDAESWLISPSIDLTDAEDVTLTLTHVFRYSSDVSMKISTDNGSSWENLTLSPWATASSWTFGSSTADLAGYKGETIKLAFVYIGNSTACPTWEIQSISLEGTKNVTTTSSSMEHVSGYPKEVTGTSASVTTLAPTTTYYYTVTPSGGSVSNQIEVTTPACSCTYTITATTDDDSMGTVSVTTP